MGNVWRSTRNFIYKRMLHADDTPHRIALGVGLATFVGFTPTMGAQTLIAVSLAALLRANKAVCLPFVWITNPLTFGPIYWACWRLGVAIVPGSSAANERAVLAMLHGYSGDGTGFIHRLFSFDFWAGMFRVMVEIGAELWLGCVVVGLVAGVSLYFATKWTVLAYRTRRHEHMMRAHERRERRRAARAARKVVAAGDAG